ncbi:transcriptional regulator [Nocardioides iriomotensis]|uniref:Transcriptional regulator n=1 Tax=Nocardioides iriomotensis TaxID=715784 RepID=A0A4Q5JAU0_9ACTN|nr:transcriptional regulator [Nocardioides iriomotensis]RYU14915.1 transcriptional regulator [Nocardioides iriomotensis]
MTPSSEQWSAPSGLLERARQLHAAHDEFLATGRTTSGVRPLVEQSWRRALEGGHDPEAGSAPVPLVDDALRRHRDAHPLAPMMPVIRRLLVEDATDTGLLVGVSDAAGHLLWVEGQQRLRSAAESIHFVEGSLWSESAAGTNAPGTSLALDQPVQIFAAEHLSRQVTGWSCTAAPIHDPDTGAVLGALDVTGGDDVAAPRTLSIVRATVAAVESQLRVHRLMTPAGAVLATGHDTAVPTLRVLGGGAGVLETPRGPVRLSLRHTELLLLLAAHPHGLTGEQLAVALDEHDLAPVTVRAEMSRLRGVLDPLRLLARPYRLDAPLRTDADHVKELLTRGMVGSAVAAYRGPLLPASDSPGVARLRDGLHEDLRAAVLGSRDPDALLRFGDTEHGRDDWHVWQAAAGLVDPMSSRWPGVQAHLDALERELGRPH